MRVDVSTKLECTAAKAWNEVQKSSLLLRVIWPLAKIVPVDGAGFPERWREGLTVQCKCFVFGFIPIGIRAIHFERIDQQDYEINTREHDPLVRRWDHQVSVRPLGESRSIYRDTIDIDAKSLTLLVWAWANWFYRHRQRRWRTLAKTL
ncbi:hypothetical protein SAMN05519103_06860 [Rhizobiales bacterium GAS113]|nr:hypothetical protein SAMN05519103_06860 [Rhizobiales bacterium GAS113]